jgi:hypothetical protein
MAEFGIGRVGPIGGSIPVPIRIGTQLYNKHLASGGKDVVRKRRIYKRRFNEDEDMVMPVVMQMRMLGHTECE